MVVYSAACVAAPPPHKVESRRAATKPWTSYEAFSVDRIPGFTPSPDPALDEYGGWLGTHVGNPDGFFRARKINGRWWMVDPAGNLFLAKAVAGFKPGAGGSERQKAALKDRFGDVDGWVSSEVAFLKSCGFNALGSWSEHKAYGKPGQAGCTTPPPQSLEEPVGMIERRVLTLPRRVVDNAPSWHIGFSPTDHPLRKERQ